MTYFFILGKNPKLSVAEIKSVIKEGNFKYEPPNILFLETNEINTANLMKKLGGTIKIGKVLGSIKKLEDLKKLVLKELKDDVGKIYFGVSNYADYSARDIKRTAMEIKKELKQFNGSARWVSSKEKILSSVIVKTNKLLENGVEICLFKDGFVGKTLAVQEFEEFEKRDYEKPSRDILRGMLPVKLAKMMINLSEAKKDNTILDPFCGTGTILTEAMMMDYKKLIGSDIDSTALDQTDNNIRWLREQYEIENINTDLFLSRADEISKKLSANSVDIIITEPFLGPLLRDGEAEEKIKKIIEELSELYLNSLKDWKKIIKKNARIVMIFPIFKNYKINIVESLKKMGYKKINYENLIYERPGQKIRRSIEIFEKVW